MKIKDSFEQLAEAGYKLRTSSQLQNDVLQALLDITDGHVDATYDGTIVLTNGRVVRLVTNSDQNTYTFYTNKSSNDELTVQTGPLIPNEETTSTQIINGLEITITELISDVNDSMRLNGVLATLCDEICINNGLSISDATAIVNGTFINHGDTSIILLAHLTSLGTVISAESMIMLLKSMAEGVQDARKVDGSILVDTTRRSMQAFVGTVIIGTIITTVSMALIATGNLALALIGLLVSGIVGLYNAIKENVNNETSFKINYQSNNQLFENPCIGLLGECNLNHGGYGLEAQSKGILYTSLPGLAIYQWDGGFNVFLTCDCEPFALVNSTLGEGQITVNQHADGSSYGLGVSTPTIQRIHFGRQSYYTEPDDLSNVNFQYPVINPADNLFERYNSPEDWEIALRLLTGVLHYASLALHDSSSEYNSFEILIYVDTEGGMPNDLVDTTSNQRCIYNLGLCAVAVKLAADLNDPKTLGEWAFRNLSQILNTLNVIQMTGSQTHLDMGHLSYMDPNQSVASFFVGANALEKGQVRTTVQDGRNVSVAASVFGANVAKSRYAIIDYSDSFQKPFSVLPITRAYQFPKYEQGAFDRTLKLGLTLAAAAGALAIGGHMLFVRTTSKYKILAQSKESAMRKQYLENPTNDSFNKWYTANFVYNTKASIFGWPKLEMVGDVSGGAASIAPVIAAITTVEANTSIIKEDINALKENVSDVNSTTTVIQQDIQQIQRQEADIDRVLEHTDEIIQKVEDVKNLIL